jgi:putative ABC transport system permease protein
MLKNYFKIAIAVLKRRKFFTFISLFGISFTLTILMVATAFVDHIISPAYPDYKRSRSLYVHMMELKNSKEGWINRSAVSYYFLDHYVSSLKTVDKMGISSGTISSNAYVNNKKIAVQYKYTNADFWNVLEFKFLEGKPFTAAEIANADRVAVITADTKKAYFGDKEKVVGLSISADNINYKVVGVVVDAPSTLESIAGDMYIPYTLSQEHQGTDLMGSYNAVLLAKSEADVPKMKAEFVQMMKKIPLPSKDFDRIYCDADYYFEGFTRGMAGSGSDSGLTIVISIASAMVFLFLLLPTINLVNINITRIMERSSEIGVRKAFGASAKTLVYQFIVENIILTFLGGIIGIFLSLLVIYLINNAHIIPHLELGFNLKVLGYSLVACFIFGFISGVYPAWRMSRLNVVTALKAQS